jgi:aminopeptidase N
MTLSDTASRPSQDPIASLTRTEAEARGALLQVERYDLEVDLTGMLEGTTWRSTSTVAFTCASPGASTFVDCVGEVVSATLNGTELDVATHLGGRLPLPDLAAENVLVVELVQHDTERGAGIQRTVDDSDGLVYVWTSFEADDARRAWACFDQPDLKAPHRFVVHAPESWSVLSNGAPTSVTEPAAGARTWTFPDTPPLSTYVVVVNAGPFHEVREQRGDHSLGLWCRQSLATRLERDKGELLDLTEAGLAFFGERFGVPFPQERYDHVFVPDMGGAMENWGCVTWSDSALRRDTYLEKEQRAEVLLHEMAHMWFGDLVTMRWWDDLWLNEAFASWAATWATGRATRYTDALGVVTLVFVPLAYDLDAGPASHPIRGEVPDVGQAMANFDAITYEKGQTVLHQLVAHVGEEAFVAGLRTYFQRHAWGNTLLADLVAAVAEAAGTDLADWSAAWFDRAGADRITLVDPIPGAGILEVVAPDGGAPRPHRIDVASFDVVDGALEPRGVLEVRTTGARTVLPDLPDADLHLLDPGALTYASRRTDPDSERLLGEHVHRLPDPVARAVVAGTAWDALVRAETDAATYLAVGLGLAAHEEGGGLVEPVLRHAVRAAQSWTPSSDVPTALARVATTVESLVRSARERGEPAAEALRFLAATATTTEQLALLDEAAGQDDLDLAWRTLVRRASLGQPVEDAAEALLARDPDPDARARRVAVLAARPTAAAKAEAWDEVAVRRTIPVGQYLVAVAEAFWQVEQEELLQDYPARYLELLQELSGTGGMLNSGALLRLLHPTVGDQAYLDAARDLAASGRVDPSVRSQLLAGAHLLERQLRARGRH